MSWRTSKGVVVLGVLVVVVRCCRGEAEVVVHGKGAGGARSGAAALAAVPAPERRLRFRRCGHRR